MTRGATLFSGGGGVEALLKARINFVHAVEYDPAIAAVYRLNHGDHIQVADVCDVDYSTWGALDYLHASPVCKEFSQAKTGGSEGDTDINTALAVVRCIEQTQPRVFTLENVGQYQHSKSFKLICRALDLAGYMWHAEVLNSADFGVPQTRRRLILRAVKDSLLPGLAAPDPWVGWYAAIGDELMPNALKPYQAKRIANAPECALVDTNNDSRPPTIRAAHEPAPTVPSSWWRRRASQGVWKDNGQHGNITPQQGALLQSLPKSYCLPIDTKLAGQIVGNMVPPLMMLKIVEPLL